MALYVDGVIVKAAAEPVWLYIAKLSFVCVFKSQSWASVTNLTSEKADFEQLKADLEAL